MSGMLDLRVKCQDILDADKCNDLFIGLDEYKNLAVIGPCGQSIISFKSIPLHNGRVPVKHIDTLFDLFCKAWDKVKPEVVKYVDINKQLTKIKEPTFNGNKIMFNYHGLYKNTPSLDTEDAYAISQIHVKYADDLPTLLIKFKEDEPIISNYSYYKQAISKPTNYRLGINSYTNADDKYITEIVYMYDVELPKFQKVCKYALEYFKLELESKVIKNRLNTCKL